MEKYLKEQILPLDSRLTCRGLGMLWGVDLSAIDRALALKAVHEGFDRGIIMEVAGRGDSVLKLMPPLTIEDEVLMEGLDIVRQAVQAVL